MVAGVKRPQIGKDGRSANNAVSDQEPRTLKPRVAYTDGLLCGTNILADVRRCPQPHSGDGLYQNSVDLQTAGGGTRRQCGPAAIPKSPVPSSEYAGKPTPWTAGPTGRKAAIGGFCAFHGICGSRRSRSSRRTGTVRTRQPSLDELPSSVTQGESRGHRRRCQPHSYQPEGFRPGSPMVTTPVCRPGGSFCWRLGLWALLTKRESAIVAQSALPHSIRAPLRLVEVFRAPAPTPLTGEFRNIFE